MTSGILVFGFFCLVLLGIPYIGPLDFLTLAVRPMLNAIKTPIFGIPLVAVGYLFYLLLCVILSLDALRQPAMSGRMMGEVARRRARPWLVTASLLLLLVGILVAVVVLWTITNTKVGDYYVLEAQDYITIGRFDLVVSTLIAAVTVLLGQAMTAYEVFTGKPLPRQGLARQWKAASALAAGYGVLIGGALVLGVEPVYAVLLTALLMTVFLALLSWRSLPRLGAEDASIAPLCRQPALVRCVGLDIRWRTIRPIRSSHFAKLCSIRRSPPHSRRFDGRLCPGPELSAGSIYSCPRLPA